jgi:hypothetical protein
MKRPEAERVIHLLSLANRNSQQPCDNEKTVLRHNLDITQVSVRSFSTRAKSGVGRNLHHGMGYRGMADLVIRVRRGGRATILAYRLSMRFNRSRALQHPVELPGRTESAGGGQRDAATIACDNVADQAPGSGCQAGATLELIGFAHNGSEIQSPARHHSWRTR